MVLGGCTTLEPLSNVEIFQRVTRDKGSIAASVSELPQDRPLTFADAAVHALARNLDIRLASLDALIAKGNLDLNELNRLPSLLYSAGYTYRDPPGAATDKTPGDARRLTQSLEVSLNLLDFGISYLRSKGDANTTLMAEERRRRMANMILNEVRQAYWQARLGEERLPQLRAIISQIDEAMRQSVRLSAARLQDPLISLTYQEGLVELRRQIHTFEVDVEAARIRLARLLNVHPGQIVKLAQESPDDPITALAGVDRNTLEEYALIMRSELRELDYSARNRRLDVIIAYAQALPSLKLRAARMKDSSTSLADNTWDEQGSSVSWNLLSIVSSLQRAEVSRRNLASVELRRLAVSMSVMEQVGIARSQIAVFNEDHRLAKEQTDLRRKIHDVRSVRLPFGENDELERVRAAVAVVAAAIREDRAYAALQKSYGDMLTALGIDQFPEDLRLDLPEVAAMAIHGHLRKLPALVAELPAQMAIEMAKASAAQPAAPVRP